MIRLKIFTLTTIKKLLKEREMKSLKLTLKESFQETRILEI